MMGEGGGGKGSNGKMESSNAILLLQVISVCATVNVYVMFVLSLSVPYFSYLWVSGGLCFEIHPFLGILTDVWSVLCVRYYVYHDK